MALLLASIAQQLAIVSRLIPEHAPDVIVTKKLHPSRQSPGLERVSQSIVQLATGDGLPILAYSIEEVEAFFSPHNRTNKRGLSELLCLRHPALRHELRKECGSLNPYHVRVFEAVALGTMAAQATAGGSDLASPPSQKSDSDSSTYPLTAPPSSIL